MGWTCEPVLCVVGPGGCSLCESISVCESQLFLLPQNSGRRTEKHKVVGNKLGQARWSPFQPPFPYSCRYRLSFTPYGDTSHHSLWPAPAFLVACRHIPGSVSVQLLGAVCACTECGAQHAGGGARAVCVCMSHRLVVVCCRCCCLEL